MKKLSIIALTLSLLMICVGCTAQSDNNDSKDTEGKISASVSQSTENAKDKKETTTEKNGENKRGETTSSPKETPVIPIP